MVESSISDTKSSLKIEWIKLDSEKKGSKTPIHALTTLTLTPKQCRPEDQSKVAHDPIGKGMRSTIATQSFNRFKVTRLGTILEEKKLSTNGIINNYHVVWDTIKFHNFHIFTRLWNSYIPS